MTWMETADKCCSSARFQSQGGDSYSTKASWGGNCMDDPKQRYASNNKISSSARSDEMSRRVGAWKLSEAASCLRPALKSSMATDYKVRGEEAKPRWSDERERRPLRENDTKNTSTAEEPLRRTTEGRDPREHRDHRTTNSVGVKKEAKPLVDAGKSPLEGGVMSTSNHTRHHCGMVPLSLVPTFPVNLHNPVEHEKLWHYVDPSGTVQGPFSIEQLRKWNGTGLFPIDLRIWKTIEDQKHSILLTDGLQGRFKAEIDQSLTLEGSNKKNQTVVSTTSSNKKHDEVAQESGHGVVSAPRQENVKPNGLIRSHCEPKDTHVTDHGTRNYLQKKGNNQVTFAEALPNGRRLEDVDNSKKDEQREPNLLTAEIDGRGGQTNCSNAARPSWINQTGQEVNIADGYNVSKDEGQSSKGQIDSKKPCKFHMQGYCWKGKACGYWHM